MDAQQLGQENERRFQRAGAGDAPVAYPVNDLKRDIRNVVRVLTVTQCRAWTHGYADFQLSSQVVNLFRQTARAAERVFTAVPESIVQLWGLGNAEVSTAIFDVLLAAGLHAQTFDGAAQGNEDWLENGLDRARLAALESLTQTFGARINQVEMGDIRNRIGPLRNAVLRDVVSLAAVRRQLETRIRESIDGVVADDRYSATATERCLRVIYTATTMFDTHLLREQFRERMRASRSDAELNKLIESSLVLYRVATSPMRLPLVNQLVRTSLQRFDAINAGLAGVRREHLNDVVATSISADDLITLSPALGSLISAVDVVARSSLANPPEFVQAAAATAEAIAQAEAWANDVRNNMSVLVTDRAFARAHLSLADSITGLQSTALRAVDTAVHAIDSAIATTLSALTRHPADASDFLRSIDAARRTITNQRHAIDEMPGRLARTFVGQMDAVAGVIHEAVLQAIVRQTARDLERSVENIRRETTAAVARADEVLKTLASKDFEARRVDDKKINLPSRAAQDGYIRGLLYLVRAQNVAVANASTRAREPILRHLPDANAAALVPVPVGRPPPWFTNMRRAFLQVLCIHVCEMIAVLRPAGPDREAARLNTFFNAWDTVFRTRAGAESLLVPDGPPGRVDEATARTRFRWALEALFAVDELLAAFARFLGAGSESVVVFHGGPEPLGPGRVEPATHVSLNEAAMNDMDMTARALLNRCFDLVLHFAGGMVHADGGGDIPPRSIPYYLHRWVVPMDVELDERRRASVETFGQWAASIYREDARPAPVARDAPNEIVPDGIGNVINSARLVLDDAARYAVSAETAERVHQGTEELCRAILRASEMKEAAIRAAAADAEDVRGRVVAMFGAINDAYARWADGLIRGDAENRTKIRTAVADIANLETAILGRVRHAVRDGHGDEYASAPSLSKIEEILMSTFGMDKKLIDAHVHHVLAGDVDLLFPDGRVIQGINLHKLIDAARAAISGRRGGAPVSEHEVADQIAAYATQVLARKLDIAVQISNNMSRLIEFTRLVAGYLGDTAQLAKVKNDHVKLTSASLVLFYADEEESELSRLRLRYEQAAVAGQERPGGDDAGDLVAQARRDARRAFDRAAQAQLDYLTEFIANTRQVMQIASAPDDSDEHPEEEVTAAIWQAFQLLVSPGTHATAGRGSLECSRV
jgi:hypothetical protein